MSSTFDGLQNIPADHAVDPTGIGWGTAIHPVDGRSVITLHWWCTRTADPDAGDVGVLVFDSPDQAEGVARGLLDEVERHRRAAP